MEFVKTQLGRVLEDVKRAMLARYPIVYIPTNQIEIIHDLLFGKDCIHSLVPCVCYDAEEKKTKLTSEIIEITNCLFDKYPSDKATQHSGQIMLNFTKPYLLVSYFTVWDQLFLNRLQVYIKTYLDLKKPEGNNPSTNTAQNVKKSLHIIVSPKEMAVPDMIAPYVQTVRIPSLCDDEVEKIILDKLTEEEIPVKIIDTHLLWQMKVNFRGFSRIKIIQLLNLMIGEQYINSDSVNSSEVMNIIRSAKKQMLDNSQGLKWEKSTISGVAGLDNITRWLDVRKAIFEDPELARKQHMDIPNGVLISGIPGSGKSLMAKTASTILNMPLISLDMGALLGGIMGESEHNMINALVMAEQMAPCVLWIDEIEKAFSGSSQESSSSDGGVGRRMFGKFLTWMQEKSAACFVFATSNDISCLPPELFRSERFDRKFFTFMPTAEECATIFAENIKRQNAEYIKELDSLSYEEQKMSPETLFESKYENIEFWLNFLNTIFEDNDFTLEKSCDNTSGNDLKRYRWKNGERANFKLMTGADISSLIKLAKFDSLKKNNNNKKTVSVYDEKFEASITRLVKSDEFKPYGETNLKEIVKCFLKLYENQFSPASNNCIIEFNRYNPDKGLYEHNPSSEKWKNYANYNKALYYAIVGAINHYVKIKKDKDETK